MLEDLETLQGRFLWVQVVTIAIGTITLIEVDLLSAVCAQKDMQLVDEVLDPVKGAAQVNFTIKM